MFLSELSPSIRKHKITALLSVSLAISSLFLLVFESSKQSFYTNKDNVDWLYLIFSILLILLIVSILFFSKKWEPKELLCVFLLAYLPTEIIFSLGINGTQKFNIAIYAGIGLYLVLAGGYFLGAYKNPWKNEISSPKIIGFIRTWIAQQGKMTISIVILIIIINFGFGIYNIEKFSAVDEPLWLYGRIESYWDGISKDFWSKTLVSDKPGVTVSIISGIGLLKENPQNYEPISWAGKILTPVNDISKLNSAMRIPLFIFTVFMLPFFYFFLERLLGKETALLSFSFIALSPTLIGMSRIINPDSLLWIFAPLSTLAYFVYSKRRDRRYLYASAIFLGLALLTKYVANILFIFFIALIFLEYILNTKRYLTLKPFQYVRRSLIDYAILSAIAIFVFYFFCPATWINPNIILSATILSQAFRPVAPVFLLLLGAIVLDVTILRGFFINPVFSFLSHQKKNVIIVSLAIFAGSILFVITSTYFGMNTIDFEKILSSPKSSKKSDIGSIGIFFANFYPLIFSISPLAIFSILSGIILVFIKKNIREHDEVFLSVSIIALIVLYYLASAIVNVASIIRYQVIIFPLALALAGIMLNLVFENILKNKHRYSLIIASTTIILLSISLFQSYPYHISYASDILPKQYITDLKDMGVGSYEAAAFLNTLPDPENISIWTDKTGVCAFFKGQCYSGFLKDSLKNAGITYVVISSGRENRTSKMARGDKNDPLYFPKYYETKNQQSIVFDLHINDRPNQFVKIIKIQ